MLQIAPPSRSDVPEYADLDRQTDETAGRLGPADMFIAEAGDAHVAHPIGPARVLVIEKTGSV